MTKPSAKKCAYTIKQDGDRFKVFDMQHRYRLSFATRQEAEAYASGGREATPPSPFALSQEMTR